MKKEEWLRRYRQRFIDRIDPTNLKPGGLERIADDCVEAVSFEDASDFFELDPEGAADEEMSYWND
jgi:hypothetical protein